MGNFGVTEMHRVGNGRKFYISRRILHAGVAEFEATEPGMARWTGGREAGEARAGVVRGGHSGRGPRAGEAGRGF